MGMSSHVSGFVPPDEDFKKMKKVYDTCEEAGITPPDEVMKFFDYERPDEAGVGVNIDKFVTSASDHDMCDGFQVDLEALAKEMPHVKKVRFQNCY